MNIQRVKFKDIEQVPHIKINKSFKEDFFGSAPVPFIGRYGYPHVNIGILSPQFSGDVQEYASPKKWSAEQYSIGNIASLRYGLVNSRMKSQVKKLSGKFLEMVQEVGMAKKSAEVEINFKKKPSLNVKPEKEIMPFGPAASIKKARITTNTKIDRKVDYVVSDTSLKAAPAIMQLYNKGLEEIQLNKLLSVGSIGIGKNRKLVPTRWSITAVDDTVGKDLIKEVKQYPSSDYQLHFGGGWGNYYLALFFPDIWSYELFETYLYLDSNPWSKRGYKYSTDYENYQGRKNYADETAGGYYAARLGVLEQLKKKRRQQSVLVLRFITSEYNIPLGVWTCREACRKSMNEKPLTFASEELMVHYAKELILRRYNFDIGLLLKKSILLREKKKQSKLFDF
ncbi:MAG: hypothetical protein CMH61_02630 [Nanoarchaeota archaeon]|nr:hypothetical protein [Nanoarchaeota archaeon]|tara:strand:- start:1177 stop:2364 length:1188 start_codon:yes stop_codon:yes gene_type:complete